MKVAALLTYQRQLEDVLRNELAGLRSALVSAQSELAVCRQVSNDRTTEHLGCVSSGVTAEELRDSQASVDLAEESVRRARRNEAELARQWEHKLTDVLQAIQERRKLEVLDARTRARERRRHQWDEQRNADDRAARRPLSDVLRGERYETAD